MPFFYTPTLTREAEQVTIDGDEFHHITHVFRHKTNDIIKLTSGSGLLGEGRILSIGKKELILEVLNFTEHPMSEPQLSVAFSLLRNKNDEWMVEKLTELGIKRLYPMLTTNTVRQPSVNILERFQKTAISAIKQCENPWLPIIEPVSELKEILSKLQKQNIKPIAASEKEKNQLLPSTITDLEQPCCILIGPEGGFTPEEFSLLEANDVVSFSLGNHILRAETAAICAVSQLLLLYLINSPVYS